MPSPLSWAPMQRRIKELGIPVLIIFEGWDAAGKGTLINDLMIPLDPRSFVVYNAIRPNDDEINRPLLWRYWTKIAGKGTDGPDLTAAYTAIWFTGQSWTRAS